MLTACAHDGDRPGFGYDRLALASSGILYLATTDQSGQSDGTLIGFNMN